MDAVCNNADCPERGIGKDATGLDPLPPVIHCGHCGKPCEIGEAESPPTP